MTTTNSFPSPSDYVAGNRGEIRAGEYMVLPAENRCSSTHTNLHSAEEQVFTMPQLGAGYVMSQVIVQPGGGTRSPFSNHLEHFIYVTDGTLNLKLEHTERKMIPGDFAWLPPNTPFEYTNTDAQACQLLWFRRKYIPLVKVDVPKPHLGNEADVPAVPEVDINPEKQLIPYADPGMDMAFNMIVCKPGAYYGLVEMHAWEHAMYMLEGEGILFLNGRPIHVKEKDFIYIAPYCPEWFFALGFEDKPVRFLLHWDCNRDYEDRLG